MNHAVQFWRKVEMGEGCWKWRGAHNGKYGRLRWRGSFDSAHRVSYLIHHGHIPEGKEVCHKCDFGLCVRPDHLFAGTHKENMEDMMEKKRAGTWRGGRANTPVVAPANKKPRFDAELKTRISARMMREVKQASRNLRVGFSYIVRNAVTEFLDQEENKATA